MREQDMIPSGPFSASPGANGNMRDERATDGRNGRAVFEPQAFAALIMARMNRVNAKKDELTIAIKGLADITQHLARVYADQLVTIERLKRRVNELEPQARDRSNGGSSSPDESTSEQAAQ